MYYKKNNDVIDDIELDTKIKCIKQLLFCTQNSF